MSGNKTLEQRRRRPLAVQLGLFTAMLVILTGLLLGYVGYAVAKDVIRDQIHQRLKLAASDRRKMVHDYVDRQRERVALVASRTRLRALIGDYVAGNISVSELREATEPILRDALQSTKDFRAIAIISVDGEVMTSTQLDTHRTDLAGSDAFRRTLASQDRSKIFLSEPFLENGQLLARLAAPAISRDEQLLGVIVVLLDVEQLKRILRGGTAADGFGETGELLMGRREGNDIHFLLPSGRDQKLGLRAAAAPGMVAAINGDTGFRRTSHDSVAVLMYHEPIDYQADVQPWGLVAKIDEEEAYRPLAQLRRTLLTMLAGLLGIGLLGAITLAKRFTQPIHHLNDAAREFANGDFSQRVDVGRNDELGELSISFNHMAENLQKLNSHLESMVRDRTQELAVARDKAESASRAKSDFLANMSHEIRTPLNAVIGLTEIVISSDLDDTQREYLGTVIDSAESLLAIINDILDFSKIEAGKLDLEQVPFNLHDMVGDTLKSLAVRAREKDLELACYVDPDLPAMMVGDPARLRQVITNLVSNAIKFTNHGEVVVRVNADGDAKDGQQERNGIANLPGHQQLAFSVSDTGVGIKAKNLKRLFEAFEQGDTSTARRYGGTGLGLSISLRLVEKMGGRMWAESTLGKGSHFHFTTQLGVPKVIAKPTPKLPLPLEGMRVLVVDDNATNRKILEQVTLAKKMRPSLAESAATGLEVMRQAHDSGDPIKLILSDVNMPERDGFDLAGMIRSDKRFDDVEIIFLTSAAHDDDQQRCAELRIAARLMKPVKQSELFEVMIRTLGMEDPTDRDRTALVREPLVRTPPMKLLLAEDSAANQKVAVAILEEHEHVVVVAGDGKQALDCLDEQSFDIVLMDVQMPVMDGLEATQLIRTKEQQTGRHQQIIAMTAEAIDGDRDKCLAAGMDDYVTKPIRRSELFTALARASGHSSGVDGASAATVDAAPTRSANEVDYVTAGMVDWSIPMQQVNDDHELLQQIVGQYLAEIRDNLARLPDCIGENQPVEAQRRAHMLAGAMRMFGVEKPLQLALQLERVSGKAELSAAERLYPAVKEAVQEILPELDEFIRSSTQHSSN